ncbi:Thioesterase/thiol ester dehydrase-isomerase [Pseudovirgaria hyperparasitica]|uniref:Thioesterase/thiol ester dehydrase-isomerase n=1 Tax=Pseudovirgaria hyperparasitica TaxID=470096 RepID=A0A6A6WLA2_9PEZI|nr:Thioesterase/thiol ester dehydrase-isomerase [Pseudovirgaria hyperparasitica]KAF2762985.1 Thioesterase/thiol ester dehydrase-isomerase [Pseudovirgaria hyperparasitica]
MRNLTLLTASVSPTDPTLSTLTFSLYVHPTLCNGMGNLHGGMVATIFDICTSFCVYPVCREGFWDGGHVSRTLNCVYLRPAPAGEEVKVEAEIVHLGKTQAFFRGVMRDARERVLYTCEHNKANVAPKL